MQAHRSRKGSRVSRVSFQNDGFEPESRIEPRELFIQLNELTLVNDTLEWRETSRWIRYEETVQQEADRFGQPHVASLSFNSLLNARRCIANGVLLLDLEEKEFPHIVLKSVEAASFNSQCKFLSTNESFTDDTKTSDKKGGS